MLQGSSLRHASCSVLRILGSFPTPGYIGKSYCHRGVYDIEENWNMPSQIGAQQINYRLSERTDPIFHEIDTEVEWKIVDPKAGMTIR